MSSVNDIIDQINRLSGFNIPSSSVNITSGALSPAPYPTASLYIPATPPYGTIPTEGIRPGGVITSEQILRIINALNGIDVDTIIISGSFLTSGSNTLNGTLALPFIEEGNYLFVTGGLVTGANVVASASFAVSSSYAVTSSLPLLGIITASVAANTITFTKGDRTTFDIIVSQSGSVESASYAAYAANAGTASYALSGDFNSFLITTGSITASVGIDPASIFLIQSQSLPFFNIAADSSTTVSSDLFIIKGFTSQQAVLTVSDSIVNIATHSIAPTGSTVAGNIYFTSTAMYVGLE